MFGILGLSNLSISATVAGDLKNTESTVEYNLMQQRDSNIQKNNHLITQSSEK